MKNRDKSSIFGSPHKGQNNLNRRKLLAGSAVAAAFTIIKPSMVYSFEANSRIEAGFVGLGGRGSLIAKMIIDNHKGYQITALADYFEQVVREAGKRNTLITWDQIIAEKRRIEPDLTGLRQ